MQVITWSMFSFFFPTYGVKHSASPTEAELQLILLLGSPGLLSANPVCAGPAGAAFPPALELQVPLLPTPTGCCELRSVNAVSSPPKPTLNLSCTSLRCTCWLG